MIFLYTTCPTKAEAKKITKHLMGKGLISNANIFSCESLYKTTGEASEVKEYILLAATEEMYFNDAKDEIEEIHSYELPVIAKIPAVFSEAYGSWLDRQLK